MEDDSEASLGGQTEDGLDGLAAGIAKSGRPESRLRFLPVKGPKGDAAMLVDVADAEVIGIVDLMPWR